jgi:DNA (cytosine-5)-methyltransferase 1
MRDNELPRAYYNEIDPYAAQWLRNLIDEGHIAPGDVDQRSIVDVQPDDLIGYTQCHFFAGIGGWSYAARLAGWPDERPLWTGSCPCQPFSVAGKRTGFSDERHLWPHFRNLIEKRQPPVVFGEQSANAPEWIKLVRGDLEALGFAVGAIPIEAASAGARHKRDRYWFVADSDHSNRNRRDSSVQMGRVRFESQVAPDGLITGTKWPVEPKPTTLAYGVSGRLGQVCGYGNAIVPQVATEVIAAYMEI